MESSGDWTEAFSAIAAVVAAVGTVAAVVVALFGQPWRDRRQRPRLELALGRNSLGVGLGGGVRDFVDPVTVRISTEPGKRTATDVEVLVSVGWRATYPESVRSELGSSVDLDSLHLDIDHQPLAWWGTHSETGGYVTQLNLAPAVSREARLLVLGRPSDLARALGWAPDAPAVEASREIQADDGNVWVPKALVAWDLPFVATDEDSTSFLFDHLTYVLRFDVTARDVDSMSYEVTLNVDLVWDGDEPELDVEWEREAVDISLRWGELERVDGSKPLA
jgi:hypothetical protein